MIDDLDKTLEQLLKKELPAALVAQVTITFATPDGKFPPQSVTLPALDLFLYDVRENRELRSNEWLVERQGNGQAVHTPPPVRMDCSYLITAWPSSTAPNPAEDEHRLLGEVLTVLLRHRTIPMEMLQGSLVGQTPVPPAIAAQSDRMQNTADFWQALGGRPKAALNYTVTIAFEPQESVQGPVVVEKVINMNQI